MSTRPILLWPHPTLLQTSQPVTLVDGKVPADVKTLVSDLFDTMYAADGVGLAAPQVGVLLRVVVVDIRAYDKDDKDAALAEPDASGEEPVALINPVFSNKSGKLTWEEGCLSVPGENGNVTRAAQCTLNYIDIHGQPQTIHAEGLKAVALQHECDHLDGKLFVDYLSKLKRDMIKRRMIKLIAEEEAEAQA
jgi:peptide deformylase